MHFILRSHILVFVLSLICAQSFAQSSFSPHVGRSKDPHLLLEVSESGEASLFIKMDVPIAKYISRLTVFTKHSKKGLQKFTVNVSIEEYFAEDGLIQLRAPIGKLKDYEGKGKRSCVKLSIAAYNHSNTKIYQGDLSKELLQLFEAFTEEDYEFDV